MCTEPIVEKNIHAVELGKLGGLAKGPCKRRDTTQYSAMGAKGGKAKGPRKARSREHYQAAIKKRWDAYRATKAAHASAQPVVPEDLVGGSST